MSQSPTPTHTPISGIAICVNPSMFPISRLSKEGVTRRKTTQINLPNHPELVGICEEDINGIWSITATNQNNQKVFSEVCTVTRTLSESGDWVFAPAGIVTIVQEYDVDGIDVRATYSDGQVVSIINTPFTSEVTTTKNGEFVELERWNKSGQRIYCKTPTKEQWWAYDAHGRLLGEKTNGVITTLIERDDDGNLLAKTTVHGRHVYLASDCNYGLWYDDAKQVYRAACREFTYEEAFEHWTKAATRWQGPPTVRSINSRTARAERFLPALKKHHAELTAKKEK